MEATEEEVIEVAEVEEAVEEKKGKDHIPKEGITNTIEARAKSELQINSQLSHQQQLKVVSNERHLFEKIL